MPRVLDALPAQTRGGSGRVEKYPFDEWFDGNAYELVEGEDFDAKRSTMATVIHTAASKRDLIVATRMTQDGLAIQARPLTDEDRTRRAELAKKREAAKAAKASTNGDSAKTDDSKAKSK